MIVEYDKTNDSLYLELTEGEISNSSEVSPDIVLDYDAHGNVVGIDIEHASAHIDLSKVTIGDRDYAVA